MRRFVYQREQKDCAIAAIATVVNKPYSQVRKKISFDGTGLWPEEILNLINNWGCWRFKKPRKNWKLKEWAIQNEYCCAMIRTGKNLWHCVAIIDGEVFCPKRGKISNSKHKVWLSIVPNN